MCNKALLPGSFQCLLFDFDLTLADGSDWIAHCFKTVLESHELVPPSVDDIKRTIGMTVEGAFTRLTGITDGAMLHSLHEGYKQMCSPHMAEHTHFFPDAKAFVRQLHAAGITLGVVSTKDRYIIMKTLLAENVADCFSLVVGGEDVHEHKPSPEGILTAASKLGILPEQIVYFGDTPLDAEAAQRAGAAYVGVLKGTFAEQELNRFPHLAIITNYDEDCLKKLFLQ